MATFLDFLPYILQAGATSSAAGAAERKAQSDIEAANIAAEAARFKPYAVTTGFGTSFFDEAGRRAGYELDPRLAGARDYYYKQAEEGRRRAAELDPRAYAAEVLAEQRGLLTGPRQAEDIALRQRQLASGRLGVSLSPEALGAGSVGGAVNPEQYALNLARSRADAEMAARARQAGISERERRMAEAQGLLTYGLGLEELGLKPLTLGGEFGGMASQAGAQAGQLLSQGLQSGAAARYSGQTMLPKLVYEAGQSMFGMKPAQQQPQQQPRVSSFWTNPYDSNMLKYNVGFGEQ